jgi:DNA-binding NarL/FixJ family response regulator
MQAKTRILILDDHPLFREGLKSIIARNSEFEIVAEAGNARNALRLALELRPHVVIVDISLPDESGIQLTAELSKLLPEAAVMIVSVHSGNNYFAEAFQAGARGYLVKEAVPEKLLLGLEVVAKGGFFLGEPISPEVVQQYKTLSKTKEHRNERDCASLTARQEQVLKLLAQGHSYKTIGEMLCVSPRTVEKHRANIMSKLNISSKAELTSFALSAGVIGPSCRTP